MADDARLSTGFPRHPKTLKLRRRLGAEGFCALVCLWLWVAGNRCDGNLRGMADEDLELAAEWGGEAGLFVRTLVEIGFLDGESGDYRVHDWTEHNPWVASRGQRVEAARKAAAARWGCATDAERMRGVYEAHAIRNAHHPTQPNTKTKPKSTSAAASAPPPVPVITLPLNDGSEYSVTAEGIREFATLYPAIDVLQELRGMRGWLLANERNRKTRSGIRRFINGWLAKEQNRAPKCETCESIAPKPPKAVAYDVPPGLDTEVGSELWNEAKERLSKTINPHTFETWLQPVKQVGIRDGVLFLTVPTRDFSHVETKFGAAICEALGGMQFKLLMPEAQAC